MDALRRFRLMTVRLTLFVTTIAVFAVYPFNPVAAKGLLGGGVAGTLGFWVVALKMEKVAIATENRVHSPPFRWSLARLALYAAVLTWAFTLDRETLHGFLGAAGGIFIVRLVQVFLGLTGLDQIGLQTDGSDDDGTHR